MLIENHPGSVVLQEIIDWARECARHVAGAEARSYSSAADQVEAMGDYGLAERLVKDHLFRWALLRSGYQQIGPSHFAALSPMSPEEVEVAVQNIKRFTDWLNRLDPFTRMVL